MGWVRMGWFVTGSGEFWGRFGVLSGRLGSRLGGLVLVTWWVVLVVLGHRGTCTSTYEQKKQKKAIKKNTKTK